jgi:hypothetical protein
MTGRWAQIWNRDFSNTKEWHALGHYVHFADVTLEFRSKFMSSIRTKLRSYTGTVRCDQLYVAQKRRTSKLASRCPYRNYALYSHTYYLVTTYHSRISESQGLSVAHPNAKSCTRCLCVSSKNSGRVNWRPTFNVRSVECQNAQQL